jgi:anti-sigma factor RsiW
MRLDREMTCAQVVELVTAFFDGRLSSADAERFEEHLGFCDGCSTYVEQLRATIDATGRLREEDVPQELQERLVAAFRSWSRT